MHKEAFQFHTSTRGAIVFRVSELMSDWPMLQTTSMVESYARSYIRFSKLWLESHGYSPVTIQIVHGYTPLGQYAFNDDQGLLRQQITANFLAESNYGKPMNKWKGILQEQSEANRRGYVIDYGPKGE